MSIELYIPLSKNDFNVQTTDGAHIFVTNSTKIPSIFSGFDVSVGHSTDISVYRVFSSKVPTPYSDCTDNLDSLNSYKSYLFKETFMFYGVYSQKDCFNLCTQREVIRKCDCSIPYLPSLKHSQKCLNMTQIKCSFEIVISFWDNEDLQSECDECPVECESDRIDVTTSNVIYPNNKYSDYLLQNQIIIDQFNNLNYSENEKYARLKERVLSLTVFYDELKYTSVQQAIKTSDIDLVSNIGGTLGLFWVQAF